ncbi:Holliday junction resolvase RuvX [Agaribacterium haliotis]|uniref:Holliday junction resolvase RuvX n=1 Tax=Agaribacterium haliotis TaxID=2013869 RepID=UPI000BB58EB2|nr:Holliday junction resolvase RuvX [Agaribacterium haliotis]
MQHDNGYVLAFDYGLKNIGVAIGQALSHSARPLQALKARDGVPDWKLVSALLDEWKPSRVLVGLPLNMDGTDSDMSARARKFGNRLHGRYGVQVSMVDERLSTREAKEIALSQGHRGNYGERPIDSLAASVLIEDWWNQGH